MVKHHIADFFYFSTTTKILNGVIGNRERSITSRDNTPIKKQREKSVLVFHSATYHNKFVVIMPGHKGLVQAVLSTVYNNHMMS